MASPSSSYDTIVIGSGPGGYVAAIRAAQLGKRTAVVERDKVGGRCLNYACIPAKAVLRSADLLTEIRDAGEFGVTVGSVEVDYAAIQARREKVVSTLTSGVAGLFKKNGIDLIEGDASLTADGDVRVGDQSYRRGHRDPGDRLVAAGDPRRRARRAHHRHRGGVGAAGAAGPPCRGRRRRLGLRDRIGLRSPRQRGDAGRGARAGAAAEDADISRLVERGFKRQGIAVHTGTPISDVQAGDAGVSFSIGEERVEVDYLVVAAGRGADVEGLGLAEAGVELERGLIRVDGAMRTSRAGVYAIGDLVRGPALAHKASDEGIIAAEDSAGLPTHPISYIDIPRATFCTPNVGSFGLTEEEAREQGYDVVVGKVPYGAVGGGTVYGDRTGLVKVVGEARYGELLGGHIVGSRATELIQELVNMRALEGGFPEVGRIIHGHPTLSEAVMEAGRAADGWLIHG